MDGIFKKAEKIVMQAGKILNDSIGKWKSLSYKNEINLVTDIDKKIENYLVSSLKKIAPDIDILSEENFNICKSPDKWIIDPLDGTTNFVHGFPFFCVSVALMLDSKIKGGYVYDPVRKELFSARLNNRAFLNNKPIAVSKTNNLKKSLLATGFSYGFKKQKDNNIGHFTDFLKKSRAVRRAGSAALDLCYVACGRLDGFWELYLSPWDTAAGYIIVKEAGGKVSNFKNEDYSIKDISIAASNTKIHKDLLNVLNKK